MIQKLPETLYVLYNKDSLAIANYSYPLEIKKPFLLSFKTIKDASEFKSKYLWYSTLSLIPFEKLKDIGIKHNYSGIAIESNDFTQTQFHLF